jgi:hypothetical protein
MTAWLNAVNCLSSGASARSVADAELSRKLFRT